MVVEVDGTTSPQITEQEGVTGRASLRAPTCYKECNLVVIEKHCDGKVVDRWTGGRYGPRQEFADYADQAGLRMGFLDAHERCSSVMAHAITGNCSRPTSPARYRSWTTTMRLSTSPITGKLLPATLRGAHERSLSTMMWEGEVRR